MAKCKHESNKAVTERLLKMSDELIKEVQAVQTLLSTADTFLEKLLLDVDDLQDELTHGPTP